MSVNVSGPVPETVRPASAVLRELVALIASEPRSGEIVPFGGETMLLITTGGRLPMLGQVTVEPIEM